MRSAAKFETGWLAHNTCIDEEVMAWTRISNDDTQRYKTI